MVGYVEIGKRYLEWLYSFLIFCNNNIQVCFKDILILLILFAYAQFFFFFNIKS